MLITDGYQTYSLFTYATLEIQTQLFKVLMGWQYRDGDTDVHYTHPASLTSSLFTDLLTSGINKQDKKGLWIFRMDSCSSAIINYDAMCHNWVTSVGIKQRDEVEFLNTNLIKCPCNKKAVQRDLRFIADFSNDGCYYTQFSPKGHSGVRKCCYSPLTSGLLMSVPGAGYIQLYRSKFNATQHQQQDIIPYESCCVYSNLCDLFYAQRPTDNCKGYKPAEIGSCFGDPHIQTYDGLKYTYNGLGEYILLQIRNNSREILNLQARTVQAKDSLGRPVKATVFSGFAAREINGGFFQVEINFNKTGLLIRANDMDVTLDFYKSSSFECDKNDLKLKRTGANDLTVIFPTEISFQISLKVEMLDIAITIPDVLMGRASFEGLMGNFNGDPAGDFQTPSGNSLFSNITDEAIHKFSELWRTNVQNSIFVYPSGSSNQEYQDPSFKPVYLSNMPSISTAVTTTCGDSQSCIFDFLVTGLQAVAQTTRQVEDDVNTTITEDKNNIPLVIGPLSLNVIVNTTVTLLANVTDSDGDDVTLNLIGSVIAAKSGRGTVELIYDWTVLNTYENQISFFAVDSKNGTSSTVTTQVRICSGCSGHGICDFDVTFSQTVPCLCDTGWVGDHCQTDFFGCYNNSCPVGSQCLDLTPEEQRDTGVTYRCTDCPIGYTFNDNKTKCIDIDECTLRTKTSCDQKCINTFGSYTCSCKDGYRIHGTRCIDIEECIEMTDDCEQVCINTAGSYNCSCYHGYQLKDDSKTCQDIQVNCTQDQCHHICVMNGTNYNCSCCRGYTLSSDNKTCIDIDECSIVGTCPQTCTNTDGAFVCGCYDGYKPLQSDKKSCIACDSLHWGPNCTNQCKCGQYSDGCDPVRGCLCRSGWTGEYCNVNIDECSTKQDTCTIFETCVDTPGSYSCQCHNGYTRSANGYCDDIDECMSGGNNCNVDATCINTRGSFVCVCNNGLTGDGITCTDIDECAMGLCSCQHLCTNAYGGYNCDCYVGYVLQDDRRNCLADILTKDSPCYGQNCSVVDGGCGVNQTTNNGYCFCDVGYRLNTDNTCIDNDECIDSKTNICQQICNNTSGGFTCGCYHGYTLASDGHSCINCSYLDKWGDNCAYSCDCKIGADRCDISLGCVCRAGWTGTHCELNINECNRTSSPCGELQLCVDTIGSFRCQCQDGYKINMDNVCEDEDECHLSTALCNQRCTNAQGGYVCGCKDGFSLSNNYICVDLDECLLNSDLCEQGCINTLGSYYCVCNEGFKYETDQKHCIKDSLSDPCKDNQCSYGCLVINGTDVCHCPSDFKLNNDNVTLSSFT
ncbi:hypothetical protein KUTeg_015184 [Tegillarca granosa]|uniref:Uncharacterized protein n=1 Tax=Tegillarca granosa TaxID=220873 RepID=A0ABQ9EPK5_TEGGR|nr:hypothetical protein KUTeg_015184 [Tegillarca granosa]